MKYYLLDLAKRGYEEYNLASELIEALVEIRKEEYRGDDFMQYVRVIYGVELIPTLHETVSITLENKKEDGNSKEYTEEEEK